VLKVQVVLFFCVGEIAEWTGDDLFLHSIFNSSWAGLSVKPKPLLKISRCATARPAFNAASRSINESYINKDKHTPLVFLYYGSWSYTRLATRLSEKWKKPYIYASVMDAVYIFICFNQHYSVSAEPDQGHYIKPALIQSESQCVFMHSAEKIW